ncbi:MAG: sulfotransferase family 2 domain-containing protein [Pseudorhodobacter sp.]|nr:sulfotransferase family 2 domain-containing protein [Pseudorhodobacter sp.]
MILSRGRRYIFIHIPKTGGTALALALEARAMKDDVMLGDTPKARARRGRVNQVAAQGRLWKHATLADIAGLATDAEVASFFTVTLVRNPWDRIVSYYHWLQTQTFAHPAVVLARTLDFTAFLNHPQTTTSLALWPYGAYMRDRFGQERASLYVRLEHLSTELTAFETHLGFRLAMPHANASARRKDWRGYYNDRDATLVASLLAPDIARFGYSFDRPAF